jgi:hypothetical protein
MRTLWLVSLLLCVAGQAEARLLLSREEALTRVFGDSAQSEARTLYLRGSTLDSLAAKARAPMDRARVTYYEISAADTLAGIAFVDRHVVRTATELVLICLNPDGAVRAVEILAWNEPEDYLPSRRWLETADGLRQPEGVRPGDDVPRIAGATLSGRAITAAIRRALVLAEFILRESGGARAAGR